MERITIALSKQTAYGSRWRMSWEVLLQTLAPVGTGILGYLWGRYRLAAQRAILRQAPIQVHVEQDTAIIYANDPNWVSFPYFFPRAPGDVPPPPDGRCTAWWKWASEHGGRPSGFMELQITLTAWQDLRILVDALRVKVLSTSLQPEGTQVICPVGGADIVPRQLEVTLSTFASTVIPRAGGSGERVSNFAFSLSPGESERFSLWVKASDEAECFKWVALLDLLVNNKRQTVKIADGDKPFTLYRAAATHTFTWQHDTWAPS